MAKKNRVFISSRRQSANSFFLSVNTVLIALLGFITGGRPVPTSPWLLVVAIAGSVLCFSWYRLVRSYKDINSGKFDVIHAIESELTLALHDAEWVRLGRGEDPKLYLPFTHIEARIPWIFAALYVNLAVLNLVGFM